MKRLMKVEIKLGTTFFKAHLSTFEDDIRVGVSWLPWIPSALSYAHLDAKLHVP